MRAKILYITYMLVLCLAFYLGWQLKTEPKNQTYRTVSYMSFEFRTTDRVWTIVPRTVLIKTDTTNLHQAEITADSIMVSQTLLIDSVVRAGNQIRIGGDGPRKGIHIETVNIP